MKTKQIKALLTVAALVGTVGAIGLVTKGYAHCGSCEAKKGEVLNRGPECDGESGCGKRGRSLDKMFHKKVHLLKSNQEKIGLSDEQIKSISDLHSNLQKKLITEDAKIETLKVDIRQKLHERNIDVNAVTPLVTQKYEAKKSKSTATIQALSDLKKLLTDEQYDAMKSLWKDKWKDDDKSSECPFSK